MRKTIFFLLLTLALVVTPACAYKEQSHVVFAIGVDKYYVGGSEVAMDARPFIKDGRVFVPVRHLLNALGISGESIFWDDKHQKVGLQLGGDYVEMTVGRPEIIVNGRAKNIDVTPVLKEGRIYLPVRYIAEFMGCQVEWDGAFQTVLCWPEGEPKPDVTTVKQKVLEERNILIGEYEIVFPDNPEDEKNILNAIIALEKINGHTLAPGEVFSFNAVAEPYTLDNGYVVGYSYSGNSKIPDVGGGVCRASTVIYVAALNAGLPIIERHPHSVVVDYVPRNLDAAVWEGVLDLKFKNDREVPLLIRASGEGRRICASIWEVR
ncbi:MAG: VanW family protein [Peptococcaceae bacterium]|nr:VanW family protein [Peptococcaceae bacterium]